MRYLGHGIVLGLTWFVLVNAIGSVLAALLARWVSNGCSLEPARRRARWLFALRLLPFLLALAFVAGAFAPSYVVLEPRTGAEAIDVSIAMLAASAFALIAWSARRGIDAWRETNAASRRLIASAAPLCLGAGQPRAHAVPLAQPAILLVGIFRPSLIVTRGLLDLLTPEELTATLRHEVGHQRAFDNLQRLLMRSVPDLWSWTRSARSLERSWGAAAERAADAAAVDDRHAALALASALVKVARAVPLAPMLPCASTLVDGPDVASRVRQLVDGGFESRPAANGRRIWRLVAAAASTAAIAFAYGPLLTAVHHATEILVHRLP